MNLTQTIILIFGILGIFIFSFLAYFDYKEKLKDFYFRASKGGYNEFYYEYLYWALTFIFFISLIPTSFYIARDKTCICPSEKEIKIEYLKRQIKEIEEKL